MFPVWVVEILEEWLVSSRKRINPRGVKRKMNDYPCVPASANPPAVSIFPKRIRIVK